MHANKTKHQTPTPPTPPNTSKPPNAPFGSPGVWRRFPLRGERFVRWSSWCPDVPNAPRGSACSASVGRCFGLPVLVGGALLIGVGFLASWLLGLGLGGWVEIVVACGQKDPKESLRKWSQRVLSRFHQSTFSFTKPWTPIPHSPPSEPHHPAPS